MVRTGTVAAVILVLFLAPVQVLSDYQHIPGSAAFQPLAVIEPASPDSLFQTWTGDIHLAGQKNLGIAMDFLRSDIDSSDWDVIFSATGAFRSGNNLLLGITVPYIIRDPDFNESDLLDLRVFARKGLIGSAPAFRISGELSAILPTAGEGTLYPFTLDSPVLGARLAFAGGSESLRAGVTLGYQTYLATESGDDSDLLYGIWLEKDMEGPWTIAGVYSTSTHEHSGAPADDEVSDSYIQVGVRRAHSEKMDLGLAAGTGLGGDSVADLRITATATFRFGDPGAPKKKKKAVEPEKAVEEKKPPKEIVEKETVKVPKAPVPVYSGPVVVMVAEGIADKNIEKKVIKALQQKGFATGMDPDPGVKVKRKNTLWYNRGMQEQAINVSRTLVMGGHLKDLEIKESKKHLARNWMILVLGGEEK
jgi:hypothetical protein